MAIVEEKNKRRNNETDRHALCKSVAVFPWYNLGFAFGVIEQGTKTVPKGCQYWNITRANR